MFTNEASGFAGSVDSVMLFIVGSSVILLLGVTIAMIYFVIKYNKKRHPVAKQIPSNIILEVLWITVPTVLVIFMFYFGYAVFDTSRVVPDNAMHVNVIARMWQFQFRYDNGKLADTLYLPNNKPVKLDLQSADVNHALYIPAFRIKEDVIAGRKNYMVIDPAKVGEYIITCAEYCGLNHSLMHTKLKVMKPKDFNRWLNGDKKKKPAAKDSTEMAGS